MTPEPEKEQPKKDLSKLLNNAELKEGVLCILLQAVEDDLPAQDFYEIARALGIYLQTKSLLPSELTTKQNIAAAVVGIEVGRILLDTGSSDEE